MNRIYCGPPPLPDQLWTSWNLDPVLLLALMALAWLVRREPVGVLAVAVLILAFVSPLCALSSALFSARVVHHVLLVAVAAPLLGWAYRASTTREPGLAFGAATLVLWAWHLPVAYDLALANVAVYWLMQITLLGSAIWFWRVVFAREGTPVFQLLYIIANFAQMGMLGALLTFAPSELYAAHAFAPFDWGLTPLRDQQLGGLIMWVPAGIPYAIAAVVMARQSWMRLKGDPSW